MRLLLNIIWLLFGGLWLALGYLLAALVCFVLIITIPFGFAAARMASYALWPFGRTVIDKPGPRPGALIGNVLWVVLCGVWLAIGHLVTAFAMAITIIGIPWARACFVIGTFSFWPFGYEAVSRRELTGRMDFGTGPLGLVGNVIWYLVAGWWLAIGHLTSALACFITIIGIPFGIQHIKLALIALAPVGMTVVPVRR